MDERCARFDRAAELLPLRWQTLAGQLPEAEKARAEELRLRVGQPMTVLLPEGEKPVQPGAVADRVSQAELEQLCDSVTGYSRYAAAETLRQGYLVARGGFRIGLCGTAVVQQGENTNLRDLSSAVIRISRQRMGVAEGVLPQLMDGAVFRSTVIFSPPGLGKTTLLRDMVRLLSDGVADITPQRVAVVDERGEIAVMHRGEPQMAVGSRTDVLDGCPKALAIPMLLRAANPQVIAVDEITAAEDLAAMEAAANCGVGLLATIHAGSRQELREKPLFCRLLEMGVFSRCVAITAREGQRRYEVSAL